MRVTVDASKTLESLLKARDEVKRKLEGMVTFFVLDIVNRAVNKTPAGDYVRYEDLYRLRNDTYPWIPDGPYLARNSYRVAFSRGISGGEVVRINGGSGLALGDSMGSESKIQVEMQMNSRYQLGDRVKIFNIAPYVNRPNALGGALEEGYSPQRPGKENAISGPTYDELKAVYSSLASLQSAYERS